MQISAVKGSPLMRPQAPVAREGFTPEVVGLDPTESHTIHDLEGYLRDNLGEGTLAEVRAGKKHFSIAVGEGSEVAARLAEQGWKIGDPISKNVGFHRLNQAIDPQGNPAVLVWRVNGADRATHLQSLLELAGLPAERLSTLGESRSFKDDYLKTFRKLGKPDLVVYGMAKTVAGSMLQACPIANAGHLIDLWRRRGAPPVSDQTDKRDTAGLRMEVMELKNGKKIWFLPPLYGDLSRDLLDALVEFKVPRIHFAGTAGAVDPAMHVGEVATPTQQLDENGQLQPLDWLIPTPADAGATYMRVSTPNLETRRWAQQADQAGADVIEVELAYWLQELHHHPEIGFSAQTVISDVLQGPHARDMTRWGLLDTLHSQGKLRDAAEQALGLHRRDLKVASYHSEPLVGR